MHDAQCTMHNARCAKLDVQEFGDTFGHSRKDPQRPLRKTEQVTHILSVLYVKPIQQHKPLFRNLLRLMNHLTFRKNGSLLFCL